MITHHGYRVTAFQQFVGVWIASYQGPSSGDIGGYTRRQAIARCKAEILHLRRSAVILDSFEYSQKLLKRSRPWDQQAARWIKLRTLDRLPPAHRAPTAGRRSC